MFEAWEYELQVSSNTEVGAAKDQSEKLHQGQTTPGPPYFA